MLLPNLEGNEFLDKFSSYFGLKTEFLDNPKTNSTALI